MKNTLYLALIALLSYSSLASATGALAINGKQGSSYGFSYNQSSSTNAENRALQECGKGCYVVKTFSGTCAAYAADQTFGSTAYAVGTSSDSGKAQERALKYCQKRGGTSCIVRVWACDKN